MCMTSQRQHGFTLIELIIFIVVVGIGVAGILSAMNAVVTSSADPILRKQQVALADSMLEEVLLKSFADPDPLPSVEANRTLWDNVEDYNGINEVVSAAGPVFTGLPAELNGYRIQIATLNDGTTALAGVAAIRVTVTVTGTRDPDPIAMTGFRTNN